LLLVEETADGLAGVVFDLARAAAADARAGERRAAEL
jgi:hypothetical protein